MTPFELFLVDHRPAGIWACGKCRVVARDLYTAERCCGPHFCPKCSRVVDSTYDETCDGCFEDAQIAAEAARFEKAEKIPAENYDGWVYLDAGDKFFESVADLQDYLHWEHADNAEAEHADNAEAERPTYAWACLSEQIVNCSIDDLRIGEDNAYEEFEVEECSGVVELEEALAKFNKLNESLLVYQPDYARAVVL